MSTIYDEYLNNRNQIKADIDALDIEEMKKAQREKNAASMQADIDVSNAGYDSQIGNTQAYYDKRIDDTKIAYEDAYQRNAVQKLINEKQIAERNANLGLTDSGLNRTQQTAAQLSYANQKGKIDISRQSALDELNLNLTDAITTLENQKSSAERDITNDWNAYSDEQAQNEYNTKLSGYVDQYNSLGEQVADMYKAETDAAAEVQKAAIEAAAKKPNVSYGKGGTITNDYILKTENGLLSREYFGSLKDNDIDTVYNYGAKNENGDLEIISVTYTDNNSGKQTTIPYGKNPYTGDDNIRGNSDAAKAVEEYGKYDNGYQPKGVYLNGEKYGEFVECVGKTDAEETYGISFNVFKTKEKGIHYWIWDASINNYVEVERDQNGKWEVKGE